MRAMADMECLLLKAGAPSSGLVSIRKILILDILALHLLD